MSRSNEVEIPEARDLRSKMSREAVRRAFERLGFHRRGEFLGRARRRAAR